MTLTRNVVQREEREIEDWDLSHATGVKDIERQRDGSPTHEQAEMEIAIDLDCASLSASRPNSAAAKAEARENKAQPVEGFNGGLAHILDVI